MMELAAKRGCGFPTLAELKARMDGVRLMLGLCDLEGLFPTEMILSF